MKSLGTALIVAIPFFSLLPLLRESALGTLPTVNLYTAADGGGDDTQDCSRLHPCATIEAACAKVPDDLRQPYVVHVGAGTYSAGCHLVGKRQVRGDDWSSPGSVTIDCAMKLYTPADGGTGRATLGWVAAGSSATRDVWAFDAGSGPGFNSDELKGYLVQVASGTGADTTTRWPITTNTGDRMTIGGVSTAVGPTTAPAATSVVKFYDWDTNINGALADTVTPVGYPPQTAIGAAFVVGGNVKGYGQEAAAAPITIRGCKFGSGAARGVLFNGPVDFEENLCATTTSSCFRGLDGVATVAAKRNVATGSSTFMVAGNTSNGSYLPEVQLYNNFSNGTVGNLFSAGQVGQLISSMNEFTTSADTIRINSLADGNSKYDTITTAGACLRSPLTLAASNIADGLRMDFVGLSCTNTGTYGFQLTGRGNHVYVDAASTVTSSNHHAGLSSGAQLWWASGATWNGSGSDDFNLLDTGYGYTEAGAVSGATAKYQCEDNGTCVGISGHSGQIYAPVVTPTSAASGQLQSCTGTATATNGVASVTFASATRCANFSAAPSCWCSDPTDAGSIAACAPVGGAVSTTAVTFKGDPGKGTSTIQWGCIGSK
jgi:hypothetical protein